jgi:Holliday junction resolvase RusA-like endonuclease
MHTVKIKAMSINIAFQGRRFKTKAYKDYETEVLWLLPKLKINPEKSLGLTMEVGLSSKNADLSNSLKAFEDILQKKYEFNDRNIDVIHMQKRLVGKGEEYISFDLYEI